jgi:hypothetical protein
VKKITYAGESVLTSDEIGTVLVELTAELAKRGLADAVVIPICDAAGLDHRTAELVIGQGNDVLAVPEDSTVDEPDFSTEARELERRLEALTSPERTTAVPVAADLEDVSLDYELESFDGLGSFDSDR